MNWIGWIIALLFVAVVLWMIYYLFIKDRIPKPENKDATPDPKKPKKVEKVVKKKTNIFVAILIIFLAVVVIVAVSKWYFTREASKNAGSMPTTIYRANNKFFIVKAPPNEFGEEFVVNKRIYECSPLGDVIVMKNNNPNLLFHDGPDMRINTGRDVISLRYKSISSEPVQVPCEFK